MTAQEKQAKKEIKTMTNLLLAFGVSENRIKIMTPVIENTAFIKVKLDEAREIVKNSTVVISYDNGGGQKGIRENPIFKSYEALWKSYLSGINIIYSVLPQEVAKEEIKEEAAKTTLELIRAKHKKIEA